MENPNIKDDIFDGMQAKMENDYIIDNAPDFCSAGPCEYICVKSSIAGLELICNLEGTTPPDNIIECKLEKEIYPL